MERNVERTIVVTPLVNSFARWLIIQRNTLSCQVLLYYLKQTRGGEELHRRRKDRENINC